MIEFKYFDKPEIFIGLKENPTICDTCQELKLCFDAEAFYGTDTLIAIYSECLANGKLLDKDVFTCKGDIEELKEQLVRLKPRLTTQEIEKIAIQKTIELEKMTPYLITWQDWAWPCADGDYCKFIGYGSKPLYQKLAKGIPPEDFFRNSFYNSDTYIDYLWEEVVPQKLINSFEESNHYSSIFYVFKSLNSDEIITVWDRI